MTEHQAELHQGVVIGSLKEGFVELQRYAVGPGLDVFQGRWEWNLYTRDTVELGIPEAVTT